MKKNKFWNISAVLLSLILAIVFSLALFSADNLSNIMSRRTTVKADNAGEGVFFTEKTYVNNVALYGDFENELTAVRVYFADEPGDVFTEEKSVDVPVIRKNGNYYIRVQRDTCGIAVRGTENGETPGTAPASFAVNPHTINLNYLMFILIFFGTLVVILLALDLLQEPTAIKKELRGIRRYRFLIGDLVSSDIKTKYRRSVLGILWSVLNPLLMMLVLTAVFSNIFKFQIQDFPVYYLTGYVIFNFVTEATNFSMTSILGAAGLIKKVYIPKIIFPLEKCLFSFVNMLFSLIAVVIVFLIIGVTPHATMLMFPIPLIYTFIFSLGLGLVLATLNTFFRDVGHLYSVLITVWMYLTPIIYPMDILPGWMQAIVRVNPLYHFVEMFRNVMIYGNLPTATEHIICLAYALIALFGGMLIFRKNQNKFIFYI